MSENPMVLHFNQGHVRRCVWSAILCLCLSLTVVADTPVADKIKADYLFNLTKFVEWPALNNDTLHVCVIGSDVIAGLLGDLASRDTKGHLLQIWPAFDDPQMCQIVYLDRAVSDAPALLQQVRGKHVLTVSDAVDFAKQGGCIGFYTENGQVKLELNIAEVNAARLKVNAMLIEIARISR